MTPLITASAELHVIFAMLLVGYVVFFNVVLGRQLDRSLRTSGPRSAEFLLKAWPSMAKFLHAAIGGTILFGLLLFYSLFGGQMSIFSTISGQFLAAGMLFGVLMVVIGEGVQIPTASRLVKSTGSEVANGINDASQEDLKLLGRLRIWGAVGLLVVVLAAVMMIAAAWV